jgi:hypothetical protein
MRERIPYQSFGEPAFTADGVPYAQFPDDLWGDLGKGLMIALRVLLKLWNGLTGTDASRERIRIMVNELREKKGLPPITSRRAITWYFSEFKRLGLIDRKRDETEKNVWHTLFTKPFLARMNPPAGLAVIESRTPTPKVSAAEPDVQENKPAREDTVRHLVEVMRLQGMAVSLDSAGEPHWERIEGVEWKNLDLHQKKLWSAYKPDIRAWIEAGRPARE